MPTSARKVPSSTSRSSDQPLRPEASSSPAGGLLTEPGSMTAQAPYLYVPRIGIGIGSGIGIGIGIGIGSGSGIGSSNSSGGIGSSSGTSVGHLLQRDSVR